MNANRFTVTTEHIEGLKRNYRSSGYSIEESSPDWLDKLGKACERDLGVLALVGPIGVNISTSQSDGDRLWPDISLILLAGLTGRIRSSRKQISVGIPPLARDMPLFLAVTSILSKLFEASNTTMSSNAKGVLIVSPDISLRSKYCDLFVDREPLESAFPGSRMLFNGKIQPLNSKNLHSAVSGVCFFLPHRIALPKKISIMPELIILDLRYSRLVTRSEDIVSWAIGLKTKSGILALYTCGDRLSTTVLRKAGFVDFPLDHMGIQACVNHNRLGHNDCSTASLDLELTSAPEALLRGHVIEEAPLHKELKKTILELTTIFEEHRDINHIELNRIRWLFSVYCQMPVPLPWYENAARDRGRWVPKNVISRIGSNSQGIGTLGPVLQTFRALLQHLNHLYEEANPKADQIAKYTLDLSGQLSSARRLLILVKDEVMQNALSSWLSLSEFLGKKWLEHIDIVSSNNYVKYSHKRYRFFISPGPLHYRYRWILGGALGSQLRFLAFPYEIEIIRSQIMQFYDMQYLDHRSYRRFEAIADLMTSPSQVSKAEVIDYPYIDITMPKITSLPHKIKKRTMQKVGSFEDLMAVVKEREEKVELEREEFDVASDSTFEDIEEERVKEYSVAEVKSILKVKEGVPCYEVTLKSQDKGLRTMWVATDTFVEFVRPDDPNELYRLTPDQLLEKDLLLIVDQNQQKGIFEQLIEIADNNPKVQYIATYRNIWRKAISLIEANFRDPDGKIDYLTMHLALVKEGIEITSLQTLQNWVNDVVIGPADLSSIVAIGKVSGVVELSRRSKEFDRNFARIRSLHRSIGRRVANIIRQTFKLVASTDTVLQDNLEDSIGIPLEEIVRSIEVCEVQRVGRTTDNINPDLVGRFITNN